MTRVKAPVTKAKKLKNGLEKITYWFIMSSKYQ